MMWKDILVLLLFYTCSVCCEEYTSFLSVQGDWEPYVLIIIGTCVIIALCISKPKKKQVVEEAVSSQPVTPQVANSSSARSMTNVNESHISESTSDSHIQIVVQPRDASDFLEIETILSDDDYSVLYLLCLDAEFSTNRHFADALVTVLQRAGSCMQVLEGLIARDGGRRMESGNDVEAAFSPLVWRMMKRHSLSIIHPFFDVALAKTIGDVHEVTEKVNDNDEIGGEMIHKLLSELVDRITDRSSLLKFPGAIKKLCRAIYITLTSRANNQTINTNEHNHAIHAVSHLLITYVISSGLLSPQLYGLFSSPLPPAMKKVLVRIACALHHMGQGTVSGSSDRLLASIDNAITDLTPKVQIWLMDLGVVETTVVASDLRAGVSIEQYRIAGQALSYVFVKTLPKIHDKFNGNKVSRLLRVACDLHRPSLVSSPVFSEADSVYHEFKRGIRDLSPQPLTPVVDRDRLATKVSELPPNVQRVLLSCGIPVEKLNNNFQIVINIMHFKKVYPSRNIRTSTGMTTPTVLRSTPSLAQCTEDLVSPGNPKRIFKNLNHIGKGGFGKVYSARNATGKKVAIKRLSHNLPKERRRNFSEVRFLANINHPSIVMYEGCYVVDLELWIVMEYCDGGTLTQAAAEFSFGEDHIAYIAKEILQSLEFVHSKGYAHRDIKPENIMLSTKGEIKLIDFGLCIDIARDGPRTHLVGSPFWMSPEMIHRKQHSYPTDIWSLGVCLLECANHQVPNKDNYIRAMFTIATEGVARPLDHPEIWSPEFRDFIQTMLNTNPDTRATATALLQHPFIGRAASVTVMEHLLGELKVRTLLEQSEEI